MTLLILCVLCGLFFGAICSWIVIIQSLSSALHNLFEEEECEEQDE